MIEVSRLGPKVIIKIKKGSCSARSFVLSEAEYQELKAKIAQLEKEGGQP